MKTDIEIKAIEKQKQLIKKYGDEKGTPAYLQQLIHDEIKIAPYRLGI